jgi:hypothetical protein
MTAATRWLTIKSELCDPIGARLGGGTAGEPGGERRALARRAASRLPGGHDHLPEHHRTQLRLRRQPGTAAGPTAAARGPARRRAGWERYAATRRVYAYRWGQWARWCTTRGLNPLPGDPAALCAYLTERAAGIAVSSLVLACTAIRHVHRMHARKRVISASPKPNWPSDFWRRRRCCAPQSCPKKATSSRER